MQALGVSPREPASGAEGFSIFAEGLCIAIPGLKTCD